jgi:hypothetical protein
MDQAKKEISPAAPGDDRTPDKTIGQIKYADDKTPMPESKSSSHESEAIRSRPGTDPAKKKTGEF